MSGPPRLIAASTRPLLSGASGPHLAGVLGEPTRAQGWQADCAALGAAIAAAGDALVPQARGLVVAHRQMPASLAGNLQLETGWLRVGKKPRRCQRRHGCWCWSSADGASVSGRSTAEARRSTWES